MKIITIGINGRKREGKNSLAEALVAEIQSQKDALIELGRPVVIIRREFGDAVKEALARACARAVAEGDEPATDCEGGYYVDTYEQFLREMYSEGPAKELWRVGMQWFATEFFREHPTHGDPNHWVREWTEHVKQAIINVETSDLPDLSNTTVIVIAADLRFDTEDQRLTFLAPRHNFVYRIQRTDIDYVREHDGHKSEGGALTRQPDRVINNLFSVGHDCLRTAAKCIWQLDLLPVVSE